MGQFSCGVFLFLVIATFISMTLIVVIIPGKRRSYFPWHGIVGPDWIMVILVYTLIVTINVVVLWAISPIGYPATIIGLVGALLLFCSYTATGYAV